MVGDGQGDDAQEEVGEDIAAVDVREFVGEDGAELVGGCAGEGGRQQDDRAEDAGDERGSV